MNCWGVLILAGICEIIWALGLKHSQGFSKFGSSALTVVMTVLSSYLLALAMREIPLGVSYTVWVGIGVVGAVIGGFFLFQETVTLGHIIFLAMIIIGIIGLKMVDA